MFFNSLSVEKPRLL